jgi:hypothetical protein
MAKITTPTDLINEKIASDFESYGVRTRVPVNCDRIVVHDEIGQELVPVQPGIDFAQSWIIRYLLPPEAVANDQGPDAPSMSWATTSLWSIVDPLVATGTAATTQEPVATAASLLMADPAIKSTNYRAAVDDVIGRLDQLVVALEEKEACARLFRDVFWNGTRVIPAEEFSWLLEQFSSTLKLSSSLPGDARAAMIATLCSVAMVGEMSGRHEEMNDGHNATTLEFDARDLVALYVTDAIEKLQFPKSGFSSARPATWPTPDKLGKYVRECLEISLRTLEALRRRLDRLPKLLGALSYATYYKAADIAEADFGELPRIANFFPAPEDARQPSLFTAQQIDADASYLLSLLKTGTRRRPCKTISIDEYANRFDVLDVRRALESGGVFSILSIVPRIDGRSRLSAIIRDSRAYHKGVKEAGNVMHRFVRKIRKMPVDIDQNFETYLHSSAAAIDAFVDISENYLPSAVAASQELHFGGTARRLFYYALAVSEGVTLRIRTPTDASTKPEIQHIEFSATRRADAPPLTAGAPESTGRLIETRNAATLIALSQKRRTGPATAAWVAKDDLVTHVTEKGVIRVPAGYRVSSTQLGSPVTFAYPSFEVVNPLAASFVVRQRKDKDKKPITVNLTGHLGHVAEAPGRELTRLYVSPVLDMAYGYTQARISYLVGKFLAMETWDEKASKTEIGTASSGGKSVASRYSLTRFPYDRAVRLVLEELVLGRTLENIRADQDQVTMRIPADIDEALMLRYGTILSLRTRLDRVIFSAPGPDGEVKKGGDNGAVGPTGPFFALLQQITNIASLENIRDRLVHNESIKV